MSELANRGMTSDNFPLSYRVKSALSSPTSYDVPLQKLVTELVGEGQQVLVEGPPGTGKTFIGMRVAEQLKSKGTYKFVICLDIEKASKEVLDSEERLVKFSVRERLITLDQEHTFLEALKNEPNSIAFIFDHLEQLSTTSENAYLKQLICGYTVPGGRLLLSRYPYPEIGSSSVHVVLKGFDSVTTACLFVQEKLKVTHKINRTQPLEQYIQVHPIIGEVCIIPRMAEILVRVYARDNRCIKDTETLLLHRMIVEWIKLRLPRLTVDSLYKLPAEQKVHLLHFAQIAFCSLELNTDTDGAVSLAASEISCVNLQKGFPSLDAVNNFGLVQCSGNTIYGFLHPTIHAFLAAFYLSCLPQDEQIAFYYDKFPKNVTQFLNVAMFHFGLTRLEAEEFLDPSKVVLAGMIESLAHVMEKQEKLTPDLYLELQKLIQACLFEAQDPTLVKNFSQQYLKLMQLKFTNDKALDDLRLTAHLEYVIVNSEIDLWEIDIPDEKFHRKTDTLVFPILSTVTDRFIKVDVKVRPGQSAIFILKPIFEAKPPQRTGRATEMIKRARNEEEKEMYFQLAMVCTGQRETLHRVTQLYSPVPVKSDAGDPAYASLITCGCVEQKLREEVLFEPIHPIHTVQLSSKSRKTKGPDGERDATTRKHVEEAHKNNYLEIIVLNKPSVKSITFQPPGAIQPCRLVMSTEKLPSSMSGRIAMEVEKSVTDQAKFELGGKTMEMVTHGLPLPKSKNRIRVNVQQAKETTGYRERDVTTRKPVPVKSDAAAYASPIIDDPVFEEIQLRHENDSGTNLHPPVPTSHSEFAEEERIIHYHNSAEGQSVAYFEATLTRPNLEETQNPLIVFLCSSVPPRLSPQSSPNSSPPTSSQVGGDIFRSPYDSAVSSQLDDSSSYSSSLSDTSAGIEEAQQSVNGNNEPIFPPLRVQYLPSSMSGRIAMEVEKSVTDQEKFVECMYMTESGGPLKEMMTHGLPLPKRKSKIDAERANVEQAEETAGVRLSAAQVAPSHKHFQEGAVGPYDAIPVQPEAIEKVTWRPGMIMFTVRYTSVIYNDHANMCNRQRPSFSLALL